MVSRARLRSLVAVLIFAACSGDDPSPNVAGTWSGLFDGGFMELSLYESDGDVGGFGSVSIGIDNVSILVEGSRTGANVALSLDPVGYQAMLFIGTLKGRRLDGRVTGSGYTNEPLSLLREAQ